MTKASHPSILEVCVDSVESAVNAERGGADRLELCGDLIVGGITPSLALYECIRDKVSIPIHVLLRPRFGDFLYTEDEIEAMCEDIATFRDLGANGVVIGALTPIPVRHGNDLLFLLIQKSENNVAVCFGHPFNRRRQHLEKLLDFSRCHLLRGAVCFFMRIIKVPILRSARRIHLSAPIAHSDAVAEKHHRDNADRKPDIFGIIEKKSIPKTSQWVKYYRYRFLKYQSCNGLRSQPNDINDQCRQKDD